MLSNNQLLNNKTMKLRNFFFAALAATFAFASCEQANPDGGTGNGPAAPTAEYAGDWWLVFDVSGTNKVAMPSASESYLNVADAIMVDGQPFSLASNVFTFTATEGGYTIKTPAGKYLYNNTYNDGWSNKVAVSETLPETAAVWKVEKNDDGTVKVINVTSNTYLQYTSYGTVSLKAESDDSTVYPKLVKADNPVSTPTMVWTPGEKFYSDKAKINGASEETPVVKLGTGSAVGSGSIIIPKGTTKLSFYGVAWNGKDGAVTVTGTGVNETLTFASNTGAANSSPYTITVQDTDKYSLTFSPALAADTELTFTTVKNKYRVIMWGFVAE